MENETKLIELHQKVDELGIKFNLLREQLERAVLLNQQYEAMLDKVKSIVNAKQL